MVPYQAMITTQNLSVGYAGRHEPTVVASQLALRVRPGAFTCLLGANGVGKSTLLRTLMGMHPPLAGTVLWGDQRLETLSLRERATRLAVVLTERAIETKVSAYTLVSFARHPYTGLFGKLRPADHEIVREAIASVGAEHLADRLFNTLSDGEKQKILIARALAQASELLILDEPTTFLDLPHRIDVFNVLRGIAHRAERTVLLATHDIDTALRAADTLWLMRADGTITTGSPEDLALRGHLTTLFPPDRLTFDDATGSFTFDHIPHGAVDLFGHGRERLWTQRALARHGLRLRKAHEKTKLRIEIHGKNNESTWILSCGDHRSHHSSLASLTDGLKQWHPEQTARQIQPATTH